jgi:hypothetical protein
VWRLPKNIINIIKSLEYSTGLEKQTLSNCLGLYNWRRLIKPTVLPYATQRQEKERTNEETLQDAEAVVLYTFRFDFAAIAHRKRTFIGDSRRYLWYFLL